MADLYSSYTDLAAHETEGVSYERRQVLVTGAAWASIAIHGGGIEAGSGEMARYVGAGLMNHYEFAGIKTSNNSDLHVTSTNFDEPICQGIVTPSKRTLSFHGFAGDGTPVTALGGLDAALQKRIGYALTSAGFTVTTAAQEINGSDPNNICNKNAISAGVQIEMSNALRASFFPNGDLSRSMRDSGQRTATFYAYARAVLGAVTGRGLVAQNSVNVSRWTTIPYAAADIDLTATVATDKLATGGSHFLNLVGRFADTSNCYLARLEFTTAQAVNLTLRKRVAGTETLLGSTITTGLTHAANTRFAMRLQITGSTLRAKAWLATNPEPPGWQTEVTDTSLTAAGSLGTRSILSSSNTNTLPVTAAWGDILLPTPQRFTVTRAVNGIAKAQSTGADVRLSQPSTIAL